MWSRNNTSFGEQLRAHFTRAEYNPDDVLSYTQFVPIAFIRGVIAARQRGETGTQRGLIINHQMGLGKTFIAAVLANDLQKASPGYSVIVIGPRTLAQNFDANVAKLSSLTGEPILAGGYNFFTIRANNLPDQIMKTFITGNSRPGPADDASLLTPPLSQAFEGKVVIIDEAHLFFNSVAHGREVALRIYRALMATKNVFIFPLTGSLITNSPFEAVPAINLVAGHQVFTEDKAVFMKSFGTPELIAQNRARLLDLTSGYLSYANVSEATMADYPTRLPIKVISLPMKDEQLMAYYEARESEEPTRGTSRGKKPMARLDMFMTSFKADEGGSSYYVKSRIACNGVNKWNFIGEEIARRPRDLALVQDVFVEHGGVKDGARWMADHYDYREFLIDRSGVVTSGPEDLMGRVFEPASDVGLTWENAPPPPVYKERFYFILSGETDDAVLEWALKVLCDPRNRNGAFIHVLFCSSVGSLGLDLKNGRMIFYVSMHYHLQEFHQTVARYVRRGASTLLPPADRTVQPYILISTAPDVKDSDTGQVRRIKTTDQEIFLIAMEKLKCNELFMQTIRQSSIECLAGVSTSPELCRSCVADGKHLSSGDFMFDMKLPSPCTEVPMVELAGLPRLKITVGDATHELAYRREPLRVYEVTSAGFHELGVMNSLYRAAIKAIAED